jgi:hypothetical protein
LAGLIQVIVGIALHRRGPDELPASPFFLLLMLGASLTVELVTLRIGSVVDGAVAVALLDTAIDFVFIWAVLTAFNRVRRFRQTMSALLGTDVIMNGLAGVLSVWNQSVSPTENAAVVPALLFLILAVWRIDVAGFVLARALDRPYALGVAIILAYVLLSISIRATLFPASV